MSEKCICQICTCGRHKCPHRPTGITTGGSADCPLTEYNKSYVEYPQERTKSFKPIPNAYQNDIPFADATTQKTDYTKHPIDRHLVTADNAYHRPIGDMDMTTSYGADYVNKPVTKTQMMKPDNSKRNAAPFQGEPTYKNDYRQWNLPEKNRPTGAQDYHAPTTRFEGMPTYQHDFVPYPIEHTHAFKPDQTAHSTNQPFDDRTGYKADYVRHPMEAKEVKQREPWQGNTAPFDGLSTFNRDYQPQPYARADMIRPDAQAHMSKAPLDDRTTQKSDYVKYTVDRPFQHKQEAWQRPLGDMDMSTTSGTAFREQPIERTKMMRPENGGPRSQAPFSSDTNYKHDYPSWGMPEKQRQTLRPEYHAPTAPFDGASSYTTQYVPHQLDPTKMIRPDAGGYNSGAPFDDRTNYKTDFVPKKMEVCPALGIDRNAQYQPTTEDTSGHRFYKPLPGINKPRSPNTSGLNNQMRNLVAA